MISLLITAVAVVGGLSSLNLLLFLAVLRRLREYEEKWSRAGLDRLAERRPTPNAGERIADFAATTVDGVQVSSESLKDSLFTGFFSAGCPSCRAELPGFVRYAAGRSGELERPLVVVSGSAEHGADVIEAVRHVARVVVEPENGPVVTAFGVQGSPAFVLLDRDGTVRSAAVAISELLEPKGAAV